MALNDLFHRGKRSATVVTRKDGYTVLPLWRHISSDILQMRLTYAINTPLIITAISEANFRIAHRQPILGYPTVRYIS